MVKLNRIYTRTGDAGSTGLGDGRRVAKDDPRVEAYGDVDDANGALGVAVEERVTVKPPWRRRQPVHAAPRALEEIGGAA